MPDLVHSHTCVFENCVTSLPRFRVWHRAQQKSDSKFRQLTVSLRIMSGHTIWRNMSGFIMSCHIMASHIVAHYMIRRHAMSRQTHHACGVYMHRSSQSYNPSIHPSFHPSLHPPVRPSIHPSMMHACMHACIRAHPHIPTYLSTYKYVHT